MAPRPEISVHFGPTDEERQTAVLGTLWRLVERGIRVGRPVGQRFNHSLVDAEAGGLGREYQATVDALAARRLVVSDRYQVQLTTPGFKAAREAAGVEVELGPVAHPGEPPARSAAA